MSEPIVKDYREIERIYDLIPDIRDSGMKLTFQKEGMYVVNGWLYALDKPGNKICFYKARELEIYLAGGRDGANKTMPEGVKIWPVLGD